MKNRTVSAKTLLRIALITFAALTLGRALAYSPLFGGTVAEAVLAATLGGEILWLWAVAWATATVLLIVEAIQARIGPGLFMFVGLCVAWGTVYLASIVNPAHDNNPLTVITSITWYAFGIGTAALAAMIGKGRVDG